MSKEERFLALLGEEWYGKLKGIINSPYWDDLSDHVRRERKLHTVYPEKGSDLLFKAFRTTPISKVKVVILGQDPYHDGSYDGFAFSNKGKEISNISPSLRNIFAEIKQTVYPNETDPYSSGILNPDLERWAKQGVLLINTAHTVRKGWAGSHTGAWKPFTIKVIQTLLEYSEDSKIVWILWGKFASDIFEVAYNKSDPKGIIHILTSAHPSPLSAYLGFFNSNHFNQANEFLSMYNITPIKW